MSVRPDRISDELGSRAASGCRWRARLVRSDPPREDPDCARSDIASRGPWVSTHCDVILEMGVKRRPRPPVRSRVCKIAVFGASHPLLRVLLKVALPKRQRTLILGGGDCSSYPNPDLQRHHSD